MKFKRISTGMLALILPVIIIAMAILTVVSASTSKGLIESQISERMMSELDAEKGHIDAYVKRVTATTHTAASVVETTYSINSLPIYTRMLTNMIDQNDFVYSAGLWFEPYVYNKYKEFVAPYVHRSGDDIVSSEEYLSEEYNYHQQDFYLQAKNSTNVIVGTPYYDEELGVMISRCTVPLHSSDEYIGCITVDIMLDQIQDIVNTVQVGEGGSAMLLTSDGQYIGGVDDQLIHGQASILDSENASLAQAGSEICAGTNGLTTYKAGAAVYNIYYDTLEDTGWKMLVTIPQAEIMQPITRMCLIMAAVCVIALVLSALAIIVKISNVSRRIRKVDVFASTLAEGDFTVDDLKVNGKDELARMSTSLNNMYDSNKEVIGNIRDRALQLNKSSNLLKNSSVELSEQFKQIENYMSGVNEDMMNASAATEQLNASTEEVDSSVNVLAGETEKSLQMAKEVRSHADEIGKSSEKAFAEAGSITEQFKSRLETSIRNTDVVQNIGQMAETISGIAEQINLLALNASIEAARAGEQGRGFAVVATEIGKLANETSSAVQGIQQTVDQVQDSVKELTVDSNELLKFIETRVKPDYDNFVSVARQYGEDATTIDQTSSRISEMADNIRQIMTEVTNAIQNIAESTQNTANISSKILNSVSVVSGVVEDVSKMSEDQEVIAKNLSEVVGRFQLEKSVEETAEVPREEKEPEQSPAETEEIMSEEAENNGISGDEERE